MAFSFRLSIPDFFRRAELSAQFTTPLALTTSYKYINIITKKQGQWVCFDGFPCTDNRLAWPNKLVRLIWIRDVKNILTGRLCSDKNLGSSNIIPR
jgi:hypothetical protein